MTVVVNGEAILRLDTESPSVPAATRSSLVCPGVTLELDSDGDELAKPAEVAIVLRSSMSCTPEISATPIAQLLSVGVAALDITVTFPQPFVIAENWSMIAVPVGEFVPPTPVVGPN